MNERDPSFTVVLDDDERALARRLGVPGELPPPRRTDAAFARSVQAGVQERRGRRPVGILAVALSATAVLALSVVSLLGPGEGEARSPSINDLYAASLEVVEEESDSLADLDDESLLAFNAVLDQRLGR